VLYLRRPVPHEPGAGRNVEGASAPDQALENLAHPRRVSGAEPPNDDAREPAELEDF